MLRLFASAREAAGTAHAEIAGATVREVVGNAVERFGASFAALLPTCRIWVNGDQAELDQAVAASDEVAVLPPVSGG